MGAISGRARGRPLRAAPETRPTADLIKGAIFSMLEALAYKRGFEPDEDGNLAAALAWPRVLDLYAGSGGLGIEALSRGAQSVDFVEQARDAARIIKSNLLMTGLDERARVHQATVGAALRTVRGPVDLVFLDPPSAHTVARDRARGGREKVAPLPPPRGSAVKSFAAGAPPPRGGACPRANGPRRGRPPTAMCGATAS